MELNAGNIEYRGINSDARLLSSPNNSYQIIDAGYIATTPLYNFLKENRDWNDFFALINTVVGVFAPFLYIAWQTFWVGDYVPAFKYLFISAMRSMCGLKARSLLLARMCFLRAGREEPVRSLSSVMAAKIPALYDMVG